MAGVRRLTRFQMMDGEHDNPEYDRFLTMVRGYNDGVFTSGEVVAQAMVVAADISPDEVVAVLPGVVADRLRAEALPRPLDRDSYVSMSPWCGSGEPEAHMRRERERGRRAHAGLLALHQYFRLAAGQDPAAQDSADDPKE